MLHRTKHGAPVTIRLPFALILLPVIAFSQSSSDDSLTVYPQNEVIVTSTRSPVPVEDSPSSIDVITRREIESSNGTTVADLLSREGNLFTKEYGSHGSLKTLSVRGSASEHVLVLVNGQRYNSFQNGLADLSLLPTTDVDRVEIVNGGSSALYGADALGGVVNILTKSPLKDRARGNVSFGSFGYRAHSLGFEKRLSGIGIAGGFARERGRDDFRFSPVTGSDVRSSNRTNSDFRSDQFHAHVNFSASKRSSTRLSAQYVNADRGAPGSLAFVSEARQSDQDLTVSLLHSGIASEWLHLSFGSGVHYSLQQYADPSPAFPAQFFYKNIFASLNPQARITLSTVQSFIAGAEFAEGKLWSNEFDSRITRNQRSVYLSGETRLQFEREVFDKLTIYQSLRYDDISDVASAVTPRVGINIRMIKSPDIRLRSSAGQSFRSPSLNDLYYRGFSNPKLDPERSLSFDAGVTFAVDESHWTSLSYFYLDTKDRILFDPIVFLPVNIGRSRSTGLELAYEATFFRDVLRIKWNYSYTLSRNLQQDSLTDPAFGKRIPYAPEAIGNLNVGFEREPASAWLNYHLVGVRYTNRTNSSSLPMHHLVSGNVGIRISSGAGIARFKVEVNNILDASYQVFEGYPMPGRNARLVIGIER